MGINPLKTTQLDLEPDVINLGIGQPDPALLPLAEIRQGATHRLNRKNPSLLAYGAEQGDGYFRVALAGFLADQYRIPVHHDQLFITAGASQGLDLICTLFTRPGDTIFVESPCFFLALRVFADHGLNVIGLPSDRQGLKIDGLAEKIVAHTPRFIYTIPVFHNPTGVTFSVDRREHLVRLCRKHNVILLADEVYQMLDYTIPPPPPMAGYAETTPVLSLGSFSKILAPGLRLGWIHSSPSLIEPLVRSGLLESGGGLNPFTSGVVRSVIELGILNNHLKALKSIYSKRMHTLVTALNTFLPEGITFDMPGGGFFIWLKLPPSMDAEELCRRARKQKVGFQPGVRFSCHQGHRNYIRICFTFYGHDDLNTGVRRLANVIKEAGDGISK